MVQSDANRYETMVEKLTFAARKLAAETALRRVHVVPMRAGNDGTRLPSLRRCNEADPEPVAQ